MDTGHTLIDLAKAVAWPAVALIAILILGPGGLLKQIVTELISNALQLTNAVHEFKDTVSTFYNRIEELKASTQWVSSMEYRIDTIVTKIDELNSTAERLVISDGARNIQRNVLATEVAELGGQQLSSSEGIGYNPEQMIEIIRKRWSTLIEKMRVAVGVNIFDARMVGQMAAKLADGRRRRRISTTEVALISDLHSQYKSFVRLQSTVSEWLTYDLFSSFIYGVDRAENILSDLTAE